MKVYAVLTQDRHTDPEIDVFVTKEAAVKFAKQLAENYATHPEDVVEQNIDGWVYCVDYSCESDSIRVTEHDLIQ